MKPAHARAGPVASFCVLLSTLLLRLERKMRVHPSTAKRKENTEPLPSTQYLALAVPPYAQNHDSLQMADDVERECARAANDQELAQVVHGSHDTGGAYTPKDVGGYS